MPERFQWNTVTLLLKSTLTNLMKGELLEPFRLVGGTSLSLQLGHRKSDDIDLFTEVPYDSIDFNSIAGHHRRDHCYENRYCPAGGRKKDFWDLHELLDEYSPAQMIELHARRYPYGHDESAIRANFVDFTRADGDFDPVCLRGKYWELIKLDVVERMAAQ